jgi:hypothetical protein
VEGLGRKFDERWGLKSLSASSGSTMHLGGGTPESLLGLPDPPSVPLALPIL